VPDGSGLGPSSAKPGVDSPANSPAARTMAAPADTVADNFVDNVVENNDKRCKRLCPGFIMSGCSCL
jgi:hypothetical protein